MSGKGNSLPTSIRPAGVHPVAPFKRRRETAGRKSVHPEDLRRCLKAYTNAF